MRNAAVLLTTVAAGVYTTKAGTGVAGRFIEARLGKPSLVRETSRVTVSSFLKQLISTMKHMFGVGVAAQDSMKGVGLEETLDNQLRKIAILMSHTKKNCVPFHHLLLHGPPGTGKVRNIIHLYLMRYSTCHMPTYVMVSTWLTSQMKMCLILYNSPFCICFYSQTLSFRQCLHKA